jgi:hypothetical protein
VSGLTRPGALSHRHTLHTSYCSFVKWLLRVPIEGGTVDFEY